MMGRKATALDLFVFLFIMWLPSMVSIRRSGQKTKLAKMSMLL